MKNIKIYPKDWLQLHPYKQSDPTDSYYTNIANRIYGMLEETRLAYSFEKDEVKQISIRMAAYFEDVISGLNIWRSFITEHKALYGKFLPFYTPDDHYYDDEVNYEDIRFLLWHYTQQYHGFHKGTFVSPDNAANGDTAKLIYQMFCDEWTTAPENERLQQLFAPETRYEDVDKYNELLHWFHYQCYLFTDSHQELTDTVKEYWEQTKEKDEQFIMTAYEALAHISKSAFLAYTAPKWLSLIFPADHPDHSLFVEEGEKSQAFKEPVSEESKKMLTEHFEKFTAAAEGKALLYFQNKREFLDFLTKIGIETEGATGDTASRKFAVYATPSEGLQVLADGVEYIKDENNPFYNQKKAENQGLSFFMIRKCSPYLLRILEEKGMLADAQAKSLAGEERSKAIVHENWEFLMRYFLREYIIRKTKCFDFWERNVLFPKTKRSFFRTPTPLPCPFPLNFSLLIITKKFGNLAKNRYICIV